MKVETGPPSELLVVAESSTASSEAAQVLVPPSRGTNVSRYSAGTSLPTYIVDFAPALTTAACLRLSRATADSPANSTGLHWAGTDCFAAPIAAVATVEACSADLFSVALGRLRSVTQTRSSTAVDATSEVVRAALHVAYDLDEKGEGRAAAREIMSFVEDALFSSAFVDANKLLIDADVSKMSTRSMTGLIRSTYIARKALPAWEDVYARAWERATKLGTKPEALFIGMPKPQADAAHTG